MARTAPVPNFPAIPGMNPGIFILGGGGDGGGSGAGGGKGKGKGQGGDGKNGGKDGQGDGKGACGQGAGSDGGACPNNHGGSMGAKGGASQGDPVNFLTGEVFTHGIADVSLPGPLPLDIVRSYRSGAREHDVGLGWGWSHGLCWRVEQRRRTVLVHTFDGMEETFGNLPPDTALLGPHGWLLHREAEGFVLEIPDGRSYELEPDPGDMAAQSFRLAAIRDRAGNRITLSYEGTFLARVTDSVGRVVHARRTTCGRIAAWEMTLRTGEPFVLARFRYDSDGHLVEVRDAEGHPTSFEYDSDHRMITKRHSTGLVFHYRYDEAGRCVETWGDYEGAEDPCLAPNLPDLLADRKTAAKGIHHVILEYGPGGYSEAVDATTIHSAAANDLGKVDKAVCGGSVYTRRYDARGHLIEFVDPMGAVTTWERDFYGNETKVVDPLGNTTRFERDAAGDLLQVIDPEGGVTTVDRSTRAHRWVDPIGAVFEARYDTRGLLQEVIAPTGHRRRYVHDVHGNLIEIHGALGAQWTATYDELGRRCSFTTPEGATTRLYHDRRGFLVRVEEPSGGVLQYGYDGEGMLTSIVDADGGVTRLLRGGSGVLADAHLPDGTCIRFRYDRMERLVAVYNAAGESHTFQLNALGVVCSERTFDGRTISYKTDQLGRVIKISGDAESVELQRDAAGRVIKKTYEDDTEESFEYNARGEVVRAAGPHAEVRFERNAVGWITRETQTAFGRTYSVAIEYDLLGRATKKTTSDGHAIEWAHDDATRRLTTRLDSVAILSSFHDLMGREVRTILPDGGRIEAQYDVDGRILTRQVLTASSTPGLGRNEPAWRSGAPAGAIVEERYSFTPSGSLRGRWDRELGQLDFEHDPMGQMTAAIPRWAGALPRQFAYDTAGNVFETTPGADKAVYGAGGRLERKGKTDLLWDDRGCLFERRDGSATGEAQTTRYHIGSRGLLDQIDLPDGRRVENAYDPFARRVRKTVIDASSALPCVLSTQHFFWDGMTLAAEVHVDSVGTETTRFYCFDGNGMPWAHKTKREAGGTWTEEPWRFYVNDPLTGYPERLLDGAGEVVAELRRDAWGRLETTGSEPPTALRFAGQYEDQETGLFYNRHRFYDPELAR
ncbi:MAG: DUF6531 domain-containing protein, partial [Polyangiaceae bacterium]